MADFSASISNAIKNTFPEAKRAKCYYHFVQNTIKRFSKKNYEHLQEYVYFLGNCLTKNEIKFAWNLRKKHIKQKSRLKILPMNFWSMWRKSTCMKKIFISTLERLPQV